MERDIELGNVSERSDANLKSRWSNLGEVFLLAYQTLGVVYGDLATSPLYVYPTMNFKDPQGEDYFGTFSIIFWTLSLIGLVKYVFIVLRADNKGEGGTFALYSILRRHLANVTPEKSRLARFIQSNKTAKQMLLFVAMLGTCMLIGDGVFTPAVSVLSAMDGIGTATSKINQSTIVWLSAAVLLVLFLLQQHGTRRVSFMFSPIMALWLICTPMIGLRNVIVYNPQIYKALSPHYIFTFFQRNGKEGWLALGGTVLCITGAEAMYADLGHFTKSSIQLAFTFMVYPSVLLSYAGQSAYLTKHPNDHREAFYKSLPSQVYWPMFVISTLSAIVASQGLISAAFSIIKQSIQLDYFPPVKMVHTSRYKEGQVYLPEVNYCLMFFCMAVLFGFQGGPQIGNAFGVAVISVMLITSILITLVMLTMWRTPTFLAVLYIAVYGTLEGAYLSAVLTKMKDGGWVPFAIAVLLALVMFSWNHGKLRKSEYEMENKIDLDSLEQLFSCAGSQRVPGLCLFYTGFDNESGHGAASGVPPIVRHYAKNVRSLHQVILFITFQYMPETDTVVPGQRFSIHKMDYQGMYQCNVRYGYTDVLDGEVLVLELVKALKSQLGERNEGVQTELAYIEAASAAGAIHVMGKADFQTSHKAGWLQRLVLDKIYRFLRNNFQVGAATLKVPTPTLVEIGMVYEL